MKWTFLFVPASVGHDEVGVLVQPGPAGLLLPVVDHPVDFHTLMKANDEKGFIIHDFRSYGWLASSGGLSSGSISHPRTTDFSTKGTQKRNMSVKLRQFSLLLTLSLFSTHHCYSRKDAGKISTFSLRANSETERTTFF